MKKIVRRSAPAEGGYVETTTIRVAGVPEHFNLPWHLGLERRAFVRVGVELKWRTVPEGTGAMCKLLRAGELDLAIMVTEGAVRDILQGSPSRIVSSFVDTPLTWGVHVGTAAGITEAGQLKGVPFAISRLNSGSHLMAMAYAKTQGWSLTEQDFVLVNDLAGAIERAKEEAPIAFLWEKYTTKQYVDAGILRRLDEIPSAQPAFVIVASEAILKEHPALVKRVLKVVRDQAQGLMSKKTAPEMIAQRYKMSVEDAQAWFASVEWNTDGKVDGAKLETVCASLVTAGIIDAHRAKNIEGMIYTDAGPSKTTDPA